MGDGIPLSLPAHELAHALVARRAGVAVESITFWLFGGVAWLSGEAGNPTAVLWIALVDLLPGAPLDGGRVLWALLWMRSGDRDRSARIAARAGRVLGVVLVGLGIFQIFSGLGANGLWIAFIGWFLGGAARAEEELTTARGTLAGIRVGIVSPADIIRALAAADAAAFGPAPSARAAGACLPALDPASQVVRRGVDGAGRVPSWTA